jgi:hypothetical protein
MGKNVEILKPAPRDLWQLDLIKPRQLRSRKIFQLGTELRFYQDYSWTLNPVFTVGEAVKHLGDAISRLGLVGEAWQIQEVMTNIYFFFYAVLDSIDDYIHGPTFCSPKKVAKLLLARLAQKSLTAVELSLQSLRSSRINQARQLNERRRSGFDSFLRSFVANALPESEELSALMDQLRSLPRRTLSADLHAKVTRHDAPFVDLLEIADQEPSALLLRALFRPISLRVFAKN